MQSSYMNGGALVKYTLGLMLHTTPQSVVLDLAPPPPQKKIMASIWRFTQSVSQT